MMTFEYEDGFIINRKSDKRFSCNDEVDMKILCKELNLIEFRLDATKDFSKVMKKRFNDYFDDLEMLYDDV